MDMSKIITIKPGKSLTIPYSISFRMTTSIGNSHIAGDMPTIIYIDYFKGFNGSHDESRQFFSSTT